MVLVQSFLVIYVKSVNGIVEFLFYETKRFWWNFITLMYVSFGWRFNNFWCNQNNLMDECEFSFGLCNPLGLVVREQSRNLCLEHRNSEFFFLFNSWLC